jgi:hypothetical protein
MEFYRLARFCRCAAAALCSAPLFMSAATYGGGGSVHKNDNSGPGPAPYNTPGNPDYGQVPGGSGSTTTKE